MIRHYLPDGDPLAVLRLAARMVHPHVEVRPVKPVHRAAVLESPTPPTRPAAVALASPARLADREWLPAPTAQQQVQDNRRHQVLAHAARTREEWTGGLGGAILFPPTPYRPAPAGLPPAGASSSRGGDDIPQIPLRTNAASPRMMMGPSVDRRYVRIPRFSTAVHTRLALR